MGGKNNALYYRNRRAKQREAAALAGKPLRDYSDFTTLPQYVKAGKELAAMMNRLPNLPWPRDLFSQQKAMMSLPLTQQKGKLDELCACGCGTPHRNNIPMTIRSTYGYGFSVIYFVTDSHKSRWAREQMK